MSRVRMQENTVSCTWAILKQSVGFRVYSVWAIQKQSVLRVVMPEGPSIQELGTWGLVNSHCSRVLGRYLNIRYAKGMIVLLRIALAVQLWSWQCPKCGSTPSTP